MTPPLEMGDRFSPKNEGAMRAEISTKARTEAELDDAALADAFLGALPSLGLVVARAARAMTLFVVTALLARGLPAVESSWTLALCVAALSLFNMTKWVAAVAIGLLLFVAVVPPQTLALLFAR